MTEIEKLWTRLSSRPGKRLLDFRVTWGPEAHLLTAEQRAAEVNRVMDRVDAGDYKPMPPIGDSVREKVNVAEFVKGL